MKNSKTLQLSVLCLFSLMYSLAGYAGVRSLTVTIDAVSNGVVIGKKVIVSCRNGHGKQTILRKENESQWCDINLGDVCSAKKNVAAQLVCTNDYRKKVALKESADSEEVTKLKAELMEIEKKRLDIADKVLELKRRELLLQSESDV